MTTVEGGLSLHDQLEAAHTLARNAAANGRDKEKSPGLDRLQTEQEMLRLNQDSGLLSQRPERAAPQ